MLVLYLYTGFKYVYYGAFVDEFIADDTIYT